MLRKKVNRNFFLLHFCARQVTRTHHNLTNAQNVDNKGSKKLNQIKLNVSFLIVGKKVYFLSISVTDRAHRHTKTYPMLEMLSNTLYFVQNKSFNIIYLLIFSEK